MRSTNKYSEKLILVGLLLILLSMWLLNISLGSVYISFRDILKSLFDPNFADTTIYQIIVQYRLPKSVTAIIAGAGLSISGLLLQTLFRNPMAGPSVLGISSGAGLGVALLIMGSQVVGWPLLTENGTNFPIMLAAILGAILVLLLIIGISFRVKSSVTLLIIGLMLGALTTSIISILTYFSKATQLQQFMFWSFGSLGHLTYEELLILGSIVLVVLLSVIPFLKHLNALLLGENYARSLGVSVKRIKQLILVASGILIGVITAWTGPIAFIGLAVPHIARLLLKTSNHFILYPAIILIGSSLLLLCDSIAQLPFNELVIPINAITSLVGAPLVIWLILKKKNIVRL